MKKVSFYLLIALSALGFGTVEGADQGIGFVNFKTCIEKSKRGQQEKSAFETMKNQMGESLEKADKELEDIAKKLEDQDYMDGLSPSAEGELKQKFQGLSQELARYQSQYYQLLNQANYKMMQVMHDEVSFSAEKIREAKKLALMINEDSTFAYSPSLDLTQEVVEEMDKQFNRASNSAAISQK